MTKFEKFEVTLDCEYGVILVYDRVAQEDVLNPYLADNTKINFNEVEPRKEDVGCE